MQADSIVSGLGRILWILRNIGSRSCAAYQLSFILGYTTLDDSSISLPCEMSHDSCWSGRSDSLNSRCLKLEKFCCQFNVLGNGYFKRWSNPGSECHSYITMLENEMTKELDALKKNWLNDIYRVSLYDVLFKKRRHILKLCTPETCKQHMNGIEERYPHLGNILHSSLAKALQRNEMIKMAEKNFHNYVGVSFPSDISSEIFSYLSILDIYRMSRHTIDF